MGLKSAKRNEPKYCPECGEIYDDVCQNCGFPHLTDLDDDLLDGLYDDENIWINSNDYENN